MNTKENNITTLDKTKTSYAEVLKNGNWQRKRLEIMQRDGFKCGICDAENNLHVHHLYYEKGRKPWEYENNALVTVCAECHDILHNQLAKISGIVSWAILNGRIKLEDFYDVV